ncbi:MAG TPA: hypothetical protein VJ813_15830 [Vicinamibacterales bacterium]|nr:hypothetical protein [Vicinamibacterales bacterium]
MGVLLMVLGPGIVGGLVIAAVITFLQRRNGRKSARLPLPYRPAPLSTDVINMASIKVAGIGGFGLVALTVLIAFDVPRIGQTVGLGLILGAALAAGMIVRRRRTGSMPSSGRTMGANSTLSIDLASGSLRRDRRGPSGSGDIRLAPSH